MQYERAQECLYVCIADVYNVVISKSVLQNVNEWQVWIMQFVHSYNTFTRYTYYVEYALFYYLLDIVPAVM